MLFCFYNNKKDYFIDRLNEIEKGINNDVLHEFSNEKDEHKALAQVFMNRNLAFKNEINNINKDKKLINFFKEKGIHNNEDLLSVIFTSLHRKLNYKNIDFENQVKKYYSLRNCLLKCEEWQNKNFIKNDKFKIGDTIKIRIKINKNNYCERAIDCSNKDYKWKIYNHNDMLIKGVILKKYFYKSVSDISYIKMKIIDFNKKNIKVYDSIYKVGDQFEAILNYDIIER